MDKSKFPSLMTRYYSGRDELSIYEGLVFRGEWLVVPRGLRADIKRELHASHAGVGVVSGALGRVSTDQV